MYTKTDKIIDKINDLHDDLTERLKCKHNINVEPSNILDLSFIVIDNNFLSKDDINIIYFSIETTLIRKFQNYPIKDLLHILTAISFINAKIEQLSIKDELYEIAHNSSKLGDLLEQLTQDLIINGTKNLLPIIDERR